MTSGCSKWRARGPLRCLDAGTANGVTEGVVEEGITMQIDRGAFRITPNRLRAIAPIPLRLIVGYGFVAHGIAKLTRGPEVFAGVLHAMGVPQPHFMAWLTIVIELVGGVAVLVGAFVALVSIPLAAVLVVAMLKVHLAYGFSSIKLLAITSAGPQFGPPGYEVNLLYLACLVALILGGSGPLAIDAVRVERRHGA